MPPSKARFKVGDIIELQWDDHMHGENYYEEYGVCKVKTVGYFLKEDDDVIVVGASWIDPHTTGRAEAGPYNYTEFQLVDKRMLTSAKKVRR
jgi:hypothetical protein